VKVFNTSEFSPGIAPPAITSGNATTFTVGQAGSFTVTAIGTPAPTLTETGTLPAGVMFVDNGNGTATLGGPPAAGSGGVYALTITAHNGSGPDAVQSFTLTVSATPATPSIFAVGAGPGGAALVDVYDAATGLLRMQFNAFPPNLYPGYAGGARVAVARLNRQDFIVAAPGPRGHLIPV